MSLHQELVRTYCNRVEFPKEIADIHDGLFFVYILAVDDRPIVAGHGKKNRARVIFDRLGNPTTGHIKALTIRMHSIFGSADSKFERYLIKCNGKEEAKATEKEVHRKFGGNKSSISEDMRKKLFRDIEAHSPAWMALKMALCSSFDGISDLKKWRRNGILDDKTWKVVASRLGLDH